MKLKSCHCRSSRGSVDWNSVMKLLYFDIVTVAPLVGAWIEINEIITTISLTIVAPLVGAWIEIDSTEKAWQESRSLLSWERGLKFKIINSRFCRQWSLLSWERGLKFSYSASNHVNLCRSSRGSVDWNFMVRTEKVQRVSSLLSWERGLK